jgi:bifunctional DNase/RNase
MDNNKVQVDIMGLSPTPAPGGGGYALILKEVSGERRLPIIIGSFEAQHIALELEGIKPPRPLTHDLLRNIIENLGFSISYVIINELRDGTFFAKIKMDVGSLDEIDSRPSDAIPEKEEQEPFSQGKPPQPEPKEYVVDPQTKKLQNLKKQLQDAIAKEEYEKAAALRDEIKKLELSR